MSSFMADLEEADKVDRTRRWVREHDAAMANMRACWFSDLDTRMVSWVGKGMSKPKRKSKYQPKQKVARSPLVRAVHLGDDHEMSGQD